MNHLIWQNESRAHRTFPDLIGRSKFPEYILWCTSGIMNYKEVASANTISLTARSTTKSFKHPQPESFKIFRCTWIVSIFSK